MPDRETVVLVNGEARDADAPAVPALDPGLLGQGVYESLRTYAGAPFALARHLDRLESGARVLDIPCPREAVEADVHAAARRFGSRPERDARVRIVLTAGGTRVVVAEALRDRRADRTHGIAAVTLPWPREPRSPTAGVKATATAATRVALAYASARDAATGLWLTPGGAVSEALAANVFALVDGRLRTPPLADGALPGVTRALLLEWAGEEGVPVDEKTLPRDVLAGALEAFVSATSEPVVPLVRLDGAAIGTGEPGAATRRLQELFARRALLLVGAAPPAP